MSEKSAINIFRADGPVVEVREVNAKLAALFAELERLRIADDALEATLGEGMRQLRAADEREDAIFHLLAEWDRLRGRK